MTQRRLLRDMAGYLPAKLLPALLPFVTLPVYTAAFDPATYGLYVLAYGVADFLMAASSTGLSLAMVLVLGTGPVSLLWGGTLGMAANLYVVAAASLALYLLLVSRFGFIGPAVSSCLTYALPLSLHAWSPARRLTLRLPPAKPVRICAACAATGALAALTVHVEGPLQPSRLWTPATVLSAAAGVVGGGVSD